jgi:putative cell wall-binding protein
MKPLFRALTFTVVAALLPGAAATAASAESVDAARQSVRIDVLDSIYPGSDEVYGLAIDNETRRAYALDSYNRTIRAYDVSDGTLKSIGSVLVGSMSGWVNGIEVNEATHDVYVFSGVSAANEVVVVDGDPASPADLTVADRISVGASSVTDIAVDQAAGRVLFGSFPDGVTVVDLASRSASVIPTGARARDVTVDQSTRRAYVANYDDSSLTTINPDGSWTTAPRTAAPTLVQMVGDQLAIAGEAAPGYRLETLDPMTMLRTAISEPLTVSPSALVADPSRHAIYAVNAAQDVPAIVVLRFGDLTTVASGPAGRYNNAAFDEVGHRLVTIKNGRSATLSLIEPRVSPLPAVERVGGADRFAVAAGVSRDTFESGAAPVAYVASGEVFADALSGAAAAGLAGGPVLLVTRDGVPGATAEELRRLRPGQIVVLGGTAAVSAGVEKALGEFGSVSRIGGADRFAVSAAISAKAFPDGATYAYLASGETFPDALSASPLAGREKGPVLLTQKNALPVAVGAEIGRLKAQYVYVLGGEQAVSAAVVAEVEKQATVIRIDGPDRFAVSAAASKRTFRPHTYTVYVASGQAFPDALAGGPAAIIAGAPVLLVTKDGIPASVAAELERLAPYRIVLLGGPNAVSETVKTQLESYLPD